MPEDKIRTLLGTLYQIAQSIKGGKTLSSFSKQASRMAEMMSSKTIRDYLDRLSPKPEIGGLRLERKAPESIVPLPGKPPSQFGRLRLEKVPESIVPLTGKPPSRFGRLRLEKVPESIVPPPGKPPSEFGRLRSYRLGWRSEGGWRIEPFKQWWMIYSPTGKKYPPSGPMIHSDIPRDVATQFARMIGR